MKWSFVAPAKGDMVRVKIGSIYHCGIFVSEQEVVQFGLAPCARSGVKDSEIEVVCTGVEDFLQGGFIETGKPEKKDGKIIRTPDEVVEYAKSQIGKRGYNILYNNCEHFAYECLYGKKVCHQAEDVRERFRNLPIVDVYYAVIPEGVEILELDTALRNQEINSCSNQKVKEQKYWVWKLLKYALNRTFSFHMENMEFTKSKSGKWSAKECCFSLSHSQNVVMVALSRKSVGVDIEKAWDFNPKAILKVLTKKEKKEFSLLEEKEQNSYLIRKWTEKESLFKAGKEEKFRPTKIETVGQSVKSQTLNILDREFVFSVATENPERIRIFKDVKLIDD